MLTRYGEELSRGEPNAVAVKVALSRAGRVVFVSGVTLGLTNAGLTFCSVDVVASIGWGGTLSCLVAVAVHLTLLPALMIVCGPCLHTLARRLCRSGHVLNWNRCTGYTTLDSQHLLPGQTAGARAAKFMQRFESADISQTWVRLGEFCRDHHNAIIIGMIGVMIPFSYATLLFKTSVSGLMLTPRETPALTAMTDITGTISSFLPSHPTSLLAAGSLHPLLEEHRTNMH